MKLFYFTTQEQLDGFIKATSGPDGAEFLQSWEWGEIAETEGKKVLRLGAQTDDGRILAAVTLIKNPLHFGTTDFSAGYYYWYAPRGPLGEAAAREFLLQEIKKIDCQAIFLRIEPKEAISRDFSLACRKTVDLQPKQTLLLELLRPEEELLTAMNQKTRYNIRLAEKKGVDIIAGANSDFPEFWRLMNLTGARDNFRLHESRHYQNLITSSSAGGAIKLFFARYRGRNIATGLFCFYNGRATYLHGASDNEFRNVMAPYLLQWSMIKLAKESGCRYYDFYGIDEEKWPGVTRFKLGFGGRIIDYPGTFDIVFRPMAYGLYNFSRKIIRRLKGKKYARNK